MSCARHPRHKPLVVCLAAAVLGSMPFRAHAQALADTSWIQLRRDPARRIFAQLPSPRGQRPSIPAALTPVTNCDDAGPGSLRDVVGAAQDGDTIDLSQLACATITLQTGAIAIPVDSLTLAGPGRASLAIDGNRHDRVLIHPYGGNLVVQGLTLRNGYDRATGTHVGGGGCIASAGYLTLDATTVTGCYAGGEGSYGGGIYAYSLAMSNSTLSGNVANGVHETNGTAAFGGGAFVYQMQLAQSTVSGNRAVDTNHNQLGSYDIGGGIITVRGGSIQDSTVDSNYSQRRGGGIASFGNLYISGSTLSGNFAAGYVGGALLLRSPSTVHVYSSTLTRNHATAGGGGLWLGASGSFVQNCIVAGNTSGSMHFPNIETDRAIGVDGGHNIIGASDPGIAFSGSRLDVDPLLGPLAFNGGPTRTHALLAGSPAVDAGIYAQVGEFDQRGEGYPRVVGAAPDIGAFELQAPAAVQTPVPTLSTGWLVLLAACFGIGGGTYLRARQNRRRAANCS